MGFAEASHTRLFFVFEQQDLVNDRNAELNLDFHQASAYRFANMRGVSGLPAEDDAQANEGGGS